MKYKIERTEKKTAQNGKPFIKATLKDEQAQVMEDVLIWSDFPDFDRIMPGAEAEGIIRTSARGFKNLKPNRFPYAPVREPEYMRDQATHMNQKVTGNFSPYRNVAVYDRNADIRAAQERKNQAIAYFNATNSAISLISNLKSKLTSPINRTIIKQEVEYWRDWFIDEWKGYENRGYQTHSNDTKNN